MTQVAHSFIPFNSPHTKQLNDSFVLITKWWQSDPFQEKKKVVRVLRRLYSRIYTLWATTKIIMYIKLKKFLLNTIKKRSNTREHYKMWMFCEGIWNIFFWSIYYILSVERTGRLQEYHTEPWIFDHTHISLTLNNTQNNMRQFLWNNGPLLVPLNWKNSPELLYFFIINLIWALHSVGSTERCSANCQD